MSTNEFVWERFCRPYLNWRSCELRRRTKLGDTLELSLNEAVQREIIYFGTWEPNLTHFLQRRLSQDRTFIDVGANIGYFSILASHFSKHVFAFEASPDIFRRLANNVSINRRSNITLHNLAVSDAQSEVYIKPGPSGNLGATSIVTTVDRKCGAIPVRAVPLCETLGDRALQDVQLIKIDVEGSEYPILRHLLRCNDNFQPDLEIVAEVDPLSIEAHGSTLERLLEEFERAGFSVYEMVNDYSPLPYLMRNDPIPPRRLDSVPAVRTDLLFTRQLNGPEQTS